MRDQYPVSQYSFLDFTFDIWEMFCVLYRVTTLMVKTRINLPNHPIFSNDSRRTYASWIVHCTHTDGS